MRIQEMLKKKIRNTKKIETSVIKWKTEKYFNYKMI